MISIKANSDEENVWLDSFEIGEEGYNALEAAAIVAAMYELCQENENFEKLVGAARAICRRNMEEDDDG
jgi:hypothetical protein